MATPITVTIYVAVSDRNALRRAAYARAKRDGVAIADYREMRPGAPAETDLRMLLDPGESPPGCSILDSTAEAGP